MPKDINHSEMLDEGTLTEVDAALGDLRDHPAALTPALKAQVAQFFVDTLVRIYEYWKTGKEPSAIPLEPFTESSADAADDEMLLQKAGKVLAPSVPVVEVVSERVKSSIASSAGGRPERRSSKVPETLRSAFDELCQCSSVERFEKSPCSNAAGGSPT